MKRSPASKPTTSAAAFPRSSTRTSPIASAAPTRRSSSRAPWRSAATSARRARRSPPRLISGLTDSGVDVVDIGVGGTELVVLRHVQPQARRWHHGHREPQPAELQRHEVRARGVAPDQRRHRPAGHPRLAERDEFGPRAPAAARCGKRCQGRLHRPSAVLYRSEQARPLTIVVNAGNGGAGPIVDLLEPHLPFRIRQAVSRAGRLLPERRSKSDGRSEPCVTIASCARKAQTSASLGTATTTAASSSTRTANSSRAITSSACSRRRFLKDGRQRIVHDPRLTWNTVDIGRRRCRTKQVRSRVHQADDA